MTGGGRNNMSYSNAEFDQLATKAATLRNKDERRQIYHRLQEMIVRDVPYINLFDEQKTTVIRTGWSGFNTEPETFDKAITWFGYYTVTPPGK